VRRTFIITTTTAGVLALSGLAVAVPALAGTDGTGTASSSAVDRIRDALSGLVSDGSLTEEQADEVAGTLSAAGIGGSGRHGDRLGGLSAAATALGMTEDELRTALETDGATLASIAEDRGVARDTLVSALTQAAQERIAAAVEDGRLTQEQADQRLAELGERIDQQVDSTDPGSRGGRHGHGDDADD
jgi:polyhydroxyalkanoate synthesis regulator phasin